MLKLLWYWILSKVLPIRQPEAIEIPFIMDELKAIGEDDLDNWMLAEFDLLSDDTE